MPYEASSEFFHLIEKPVATNSDISATVLPISTEVGTVMRNEFSSALQFKNETGALERRMLHYHDIASFPFSARQLAWIFFILKF